MEGNPIEGSFKKLTIEELSTWIQQDIDTKLTVEERKKIQARTGEDLKDWDTYIKKHSGQYNYIAPVVLEVYNAKVK